MLVASSNANRGRGSGPGAKRVSGVVIFAIVLAGIAFTRFAATPSAVSKRTETFASVIEVRRYPRSNPPRLWVKFEFRTNRNRRAVSARAVRVKSFDAVSVGDRIKIHYRKRYPKGARIVSLRPTRGQPKRIPGVLNYLRPSLIMSVISSLVFAWVVFGVFRRFRRVTGKRKATQREHPVTKAAVDENVPTASRERRDRDRRSKTKVIVPKRMGNAKQRAGWF